MSSKFFGLGQIEYLTKVPCLQGGPRTLIPGETFIVSVLLERLYITINRSWHRLAWPLKNISQWIYIMNHDMPFSQDMEPSHCTRARCWACLWLWYTVGWLAFGEHFPPHKAWCCLFQIVIVIVFVFKGGVAVTKAVKILALPRRGGGVWPLPRFFWWICHSAEANLKW